MAVRTWLDVNGDWNNVNNWSGGAKPANGVTVNILEGNKSIVTNLGQGLIQDLVISVGEKFSGVVGLPGNPLVLSTGITLFFNSSQCKSFVLSPNTCTMLKIAQTGDYDNAFRIEGGTYTEIVVGSCKHFTIGAGTITLLNVVGGPQPLNDTQIEIESGVVLTAGVIKGGRIISNANIGSLLLKGDCWVTQENEVTGDVTLLQLDHSAARFDWDARDSTIADAKCYAGWLNGGNYDVPRVLTNSEAWTGATVTLPNVLGQMTYTNAMLIYGSPNVVGSVSQDVKMETGPVAA